MRIISWVLVVLLLGAAGFLGWSYLNSQSEVEILQAQVATENQQVAQLEGEKTSLATHLAKVLANLETDLAEVLANPLANPDYQEDSYWEHGGSVNPGGKYVVLMYVPNGITVRGQYAFEGTVGKFYVLNPSGALVTGSQTTLIGFSQDTEWPTGMGRQFSFIGQGSIYTVVFENPGSNALGVRFTLSSDWFQPGFHSQVINLWS